MARSPLSAVLLGFCVFLTSIPVHAASITDTLGSAAILIGLMLQVGPTLISAKLGLILIFIFITSPTSSFPLHMLLLAAVLSQLKNDWRDEHPTQQKEDPGERTIETLVNIILLSFMQSLLCHRSDQEFIRCGDVGSI